MRSYNNFINCILLIKQDFDRYVKNYWNLPLVLFKLFHNPGMIFSLCYRVERYLIYESNYLFMVFGIILYPAYFVLTYFVFSYHIEPNVKIGGGLFLHNRDIVITNNATIGENFSCMGQVTIGTNFEGFVSENPTITIEDNVRVGVGAKIISSDKLRIAEGILVGANAVVTKDLTEKNSIFAGIPAKFIRKI